MLRWLFELVVGIIIAMAARAILGSVMKGFANAARGGFQDQQQAPAAQQRQPQEKIKVAGELHKDPVCGMYVAESTQYQRRNGRETVYYCSEKCKEKDALAAKA